MQARRELLEEATELVTGDRNAQYGDPRQDFKRTARLWSTYLDAVIEPHDVAAMMILLKMSRISHQPDKRDSWCDVAGYAACGYECTTPEHPDVLVDEHLYYYPAADTNESRSVNIAALRPGRG